MTEAFERRAAEAMKRRKVPVESDIVIPLPDLTAGGKKVDSVDEPKEAPAEAKEDFFAVMPNEVSEAPEGGDFIIDPSADSSAPGVFTYAGHRLRPVNPVEYAKITAITANPKTRREKGPRRLAALLPPAGPADAPSAAGAGEVVQGTNGTIDLGRLGAQAQDNVRNRDRRAGQEPFLPPRERFDRRRFQLVHNSDNTTGGPNAGVPDYYVYLDPDGRPRTNPDGTEQRYTLADVERLLNPRGPGGRGLAGAGPAMPQGPQAPLIAPQRVPAGVIPDFIWRNLSKGRIERNVPLTFEQGPTMDVILPSKKDQEMFGELVRAHGPHELFLRYMAASEHPEAMQASDWAELGHLLEEFGHRKLLLEEVQTNLTKEDVTFMLVHNPAFASIRFNLKPERAMEVMKTSMSYLFMRGSHDEINAMVLSQRANRDIRESDYYIGLNERVHYHTDKTGIKADDLDWNRLDPKLQKQILKPGLLGWMFHGEKTKRSRATLEHIQTNRASMGYLLAGTVSNDPVLISRIVREAQTGERVPQVGERGVGTAADARTERRHINEELNENALLEQVRNPEFRANFRDLDGRTWDNSTPEAREEAFFADSERDLTQRQTLLGWFSNFLSALFSVRLDRAKQRLATEGAFN